MRYFRIKTLVVVLTIIALQSSLFAMFRRPDLENVPVKDLVANLRKKVEADPKNAALRMNLGRVYAMAYSQKNEKLQINKQKPNEAWLGYTPTHVPYSSVKKSDDKEKNAAAKKQLKSAIEQFKKAVELDKDNLTAQLSLAWCRDQNGDEDEAVEIYRAVIEKGWKNEKNMELADLGWHSIVAEAAGYLQPHLDKEKDKKEIEQLEERKRFVAKIPRPITPIAFGLKPGMTIADIERPDASVKFDADGSDTGKSWSWISRDAAWLVYDKKANGKIESGLQLFGNVTFWCFWQNGYEALSALDANADGKLSNQELKHIAVWCDKNQNGISDPGEVQPLQDFGIVEISCTHVNDKNHRDNIAFNPAGIKFKDGSTRATYDVILQQK